MNIDHPEGSAYELTRSEWWIWRVGGGIIAVFGLFLWAQFLLAQPYPLPSGIGHNNPTPAPTVAVVYPPGYSRSNGFQIEATSSALQIYSIDYDSRTILGAWEIPTK